MSTSSFRSTARHSRRTAYSTATLGSRAPFTRGQATRARRETHDAAHAASLARCIVQDGGDETDPSEKRQSQTSFLRA